MVRNLFVISLILFLLEFYIFQGIKNLTSNIYIKYLYWIFTICIYAVILFELPQINGSNRESAKPTQIVISLLMIFLIPKLILGFFLLIDDAFRLVNFGIKKFSNSEVIFPGRRKFLSLMGLGLAGVLSGLVIDGIIYGKYRHYVRKVKLKLNNLPSSFKGYKIVQISDVHSGSFFHPEKLQKAIDLINQQNPDLVLFTGDMVNIYADEFKPFISLFAQIKAKDGKFSVFGNHDYGDYGKWKSPQQHAQNLNRLIEYEKQAGFDLLRNEHRIISKNGESIYIIGVENWGEKPFPQFGDLDKSVKDIPNQAVKILMSHDPTHFDHAVKNHSKFIHLTLSGHTHGMQFGLDLKNIKWSPVQYKYKKWIDLYSENGKYLYVNRGFGVLGFPGRVGVNPEITLFELS